MEIKDRVALVTGCASGIGHAVSFEVAKREVKAIAMVDIIPDVEIVAEQLNNEVNTTIAIPFQGDVCLFYTSDAADDLLCCTSRGPRSF